jgi:hypothetical protein
MRDGVNDVLSDDGSAGFIGVGVIREPVSLFIQLLAVANHTHAAKLVTVAGHTNEAPSARVAPVADVEFLSEADQARLAVRVWSVIAALTVPCTADFNPSDNAAIIARVVAWGAETSSSEVIRVGSSSIHRSSVVRAV